jgi:hypothetical protein
MRTAALFRGLGFRVWGERASGRCMLLSSGCEVGTCMRGRMGSGDTYARPEEHHSGEEETGRCWFARCNSDEGVVGRERT